MAHMQCHLSAGNAPMTLVGHRLGPGANVGLAGPLWGLIVTNGQSVSLTHASLWVCMHAGPVRGCAQVCCGQVRRGLCTKVSVLLCGVGCADLWGGELGRAGGHSCPPLRGGEGEACTPQRGRHGGVHPGSTPRPPSEGPLEGGGDGEGIPSYHPRKGWVDGCIPSHPLL